MKRIFGVRVFYQFECFPVAASNGRAIRVGMDVVADKMIIQNRQT